LVRLPAAVRGNETALPGRSPRPERAEEIEPNTGLATSRLSGSHGDENKKRKAKIRHTESGDGGGKDGRACEPVSVYLTTLSGLIFFLRPISLF